MIKLPYITLSILEIRKITIIAKFDYFVHLPTLQVTMIKSVIIGHGSFIPPRVIKNDFFLNKEFYDESGQKIERPQEEIIQKFQDITEIAERRYATDDLMNSDMATIAAKKAIENAGIDKETLDYIMVGHNFGDIDPVQRQIDLMPSVSSKVKNKLNIQNSKCRPYDMNFGCPGWVEGMILADQLITSGFAKRILVIGSDNLSRAVDPHDRNSMIFADGAAAVVLEGKELNEPVGILGYETLCTNIEEIDYICTGKSLNPNYIGSNVNVRMKGRKVYEYALKNVPAAIKETLDKVGFHIKDVAKILLHQANAKMDYAIIERLYKLYDMEATHEVAPMTISYLGNTSVATVPTMYDLIKNGKMEGHSINSGDLIVFASVGASMVINAVVYREP